MQETRWTKSSGAPSRTVVLAGATGLVGHFLLEGLLADSTVAAVHALGRRKLGDLHPKLTSHVVDFAALPSLPSVDEVYLALGTTLKVAGSPAAQRAVDFDANLAVARAVLAAGARRLGLVSSGFADAKSRNYYRRMKGELEEALSQLPFEGLLFARPPPLAGDRAALGQRPRPAERAYGALARVIAPLLPERLRPIAAAQVARVLLARVPTVQGRVVLTAGELHG
ncbi:oxidoreductase [Cystobacter fuscus]|uniref:oxidoreductase n=1 Tax=Cystobacter fuscus TaxID=43 RepID=UPI002B320868|nr:nucleoside-diphosphate sugar epimerase [Cystobacter fuscus]